MGELLYLLVATTLILLHFNLIAVVSAQALSVIVRRTLSNYTIYVPNFKKALNNTVTQAKREYIKPILPNALKLGLNGLGYYLVTRSPIIIGSLFLPLDDMASFGVTVQIIWIIAEIANVYFNTYQPRIVQYRIQDNTYAIKRLYLRSCWFMLFTFIIAGPDWF